MKKTTQNTLIAVACFLASITTAFADDCTVTVTKTVNGVTYKATATASTCLWALKAANKNIDGAIRNQQ